MLLLSLALAAQSVTLDANPYKAAQSCGAAAGRSGGFVGLERLAIGAHFALLAGRYNGMQGPLIDKYADEAPAMRERYLASNQAEADALLPQCRQRFPSAFISTPATLPAGIFPRKLLCATATGLFYGLFSTTQGSAEDRKWFEGLARRFRPLLSQEELAANGVATQKQMTNAMGAALDGSLDQGNILGVVRACDAAFPA